MQKVIYSVSIYPLLRIDGFKDTLSGRQTFSSQGQKLSYFGRHYHFSEKWLNLEYPTRDFTIFLKTSSGNLLRYDILEFWQKHVCRPVGINAHVYLLLTIPMLKISVSINRRCQGNHETAKIMLMQERIIDILRFLLISRSFLLASFWNPEFFLKKKHDIRNKKFSRKVWILKKTLIN